MTLAPRPARSPAHAGPSRVARLCVASLALAAAAQASAAVTTTGELKTAFVLVNFSDNASQPITPAAATSLMFGQASDFYWEASYGKTLVSGATYGWYALPIASTCNGAEISTAARQQALARGVDLSGFDRVVFAFPGNASCGWSGSSTVGQTEVFLNGNFSLQVLVHEYGHTLGLRHSNDLKCTDTPIAGGCVVREYADLFDAMGNSYAAHYNAFQKERLGWLNGSGTPTIATVQASGSYQVAPFETAATGTKALKLRAGTDPATGKPNWYYVEYRQATGFDAPLANIAYTNVTKGVLVHLVTEGDDRSSRVLDMTPHSNPFYDNRNDAALVVGQSFYDSANGVTITTRSADANGALVDVIVGAGNPPPPPPPTAPAPLAESVGTDKSSYLRGESVAMSARLTRDGVAVAGASVRFVLALPGGAGTTLNAVSGSDGFARATYKLGKAKSAAGSYGVRADASSSGSTATASTAFSAL